MSHTISLSLHPDPSRFGRQGKEVKDRGFEEGVKLYASDSVFVLVFLKPQMTHISL